MNELHEREPGGHYVFKPFNAELLKISLGQDVKNEEKTEASDLVQYQDGLEVNRVLHYDHQHTEYGKIKYDKQERENP